MTGARSFFMEFRPLAGPINTTVENGEHLSAAGVGSVSLRDENGVSVKLTNVLYVPDLDRSLLSISALTAKGGVVHFNSEHATLSVSGKHVVSIPRVEKLIAWTVVHDNEEQVNQVVEDRRGYSSEGELWHARLGHVFLKPRWTKW
jgi:hypothetical protein